MGGSKVHAQEPTRRAKLSAAALYAGTSLLIVLSNKIVLSSYKYPSFQVMALLQFAFTSVAMFAMREGGIIKFHQHEQHEDMSFMDNVKLVSPLPFLFLGNVLCGLGGTKRINLAMFTALRRFSILMFMVVESVWLGEKFSTNVRISVFAMVGGAMLGASDDLAFDLVGYALIMGNNVFTVLYGATIKSKLKSRTSGSGSAKMAPDEETAGAGAKTTSGPKPRHTKFGLLFYNSLLALPLLCVLLMVVFPDDLEAAATFDHYSEPGFLAMFCCSIVCGALLNYAVFLSTDLNSATTTAVIGCLKNISTAYLAIFGVGGDYVFSMTNFVGINISIAGAVYYSWAKLAKK